MHLILKKLLIKTELMIKKCVGDIFFEIVGVQRAT